MQQQSTKTSTSLTVYLINFISVTIPEENTGKTHDEQFSGA